MRKPIFIIAISLAILAHAPAFAARGQAELTQCIGNSPSTTKRIPNLSSGSSSDALAQETTPTLRRHVENAVASTGVGTADSAVADAHTISTDRKTLKPSTELSASGGSNRATIKLTNTLNINSSCNAGGRMKFTTAVHSSSFASSAPLSKSGSRTDVLPTSGLPSDFRFDVGWSSFVVINHIDINSLYNVMMKAYDACMKAHHGDAKDCDEDGSELIKDYLKDDTGAFDSAFSGEWIYTYGVQGSVGYTKSTFYDPTSLMKENTTGTPWSAGGFVGVMPAENWPLIVASVGYEKSYKDADTSTRCPTGSGPVLICKTGAFEPPALKEKLPVGLEFRRQFSLCAKKEKKAKSASGESDADDDSEQDDCGPFNLKAVSVDVKFEYDVKKSAYSVDVPISFVMDDKGNLVAGTRFGWDSEHHQFAAGLFLGSAFSLF